MVKVTTPVCVASGERSFKLKLNQDLSEPGLHVGYRPIPWRTSDCLIYQWLLFNVTLHANWIIITAYTPWCVCDPDSWTQKVQ